MIYVQHSPWIIVSCSLHNPKALVNFNVVSCDSGFMSSVKIVDDGLDF